MHTYTLCIEEGCVSKGEMAFSLRIFRSCGYFRLLRGIRSSPHNRIPNSSHFKFVMELELKILATEKDRHTLFFFCSF